MGVNSDRVQWARVPGTPELWASDGGQIATLKYDGAGFRYLTLKMDEGGEMYVSFRRGENKKMGPRKVAALVLAAFGRPSVGGTAIIFRDGDPENCRLENLYHGRKGQPDGGNLKPKRCLGHHCGHAEFLSSGDGNRLCPSCTKLANASTSNIFEDVDAGELPDEPLAGGGHQQ